MAPPTPPAGLLVAAILVCLLLAALLFAARPPAVEGFATKPSPRSRRLAEELRQAFGAAPRRPTYAEFKRRMGAESDVILYHRGWRLYREGELTADRVEEFA